MASYDESNMTTSSVNDGRIEGHLVTYTPATKAALHSTAPQDSSKALPVNSLDEKLSRDSVSSTVDSQASTLRVRSWKLTLIRFGPLSGLFCLCLAVASIVAALGILLGSRNAPVRNWTVEPSAYLAVCTAIANQSMRYAAFQGVAIAWWLRALHGSTLSRLHHDWRSGTTIRGALTAGRHMGLLGLACIFSTLVAIDGPLLQRASTVVPAPITGRSVDLNVTIAQEVPTGFTGGWSQSGNDTVAARFSATFNDTIPAANGTSSNYVIPQAVVDLNGAWSGLWFTEGVLNGFVQGCPSSTCKATIRAPALASTRCSSTIIPVNYLNPVNITTELSQSIAPPLDTDGFIISHSLQLDEYESINLVTASSSNYNCEGFLNYTACTLVAAIGDYDVVIENNTVAISSIPEPTIVALANNTRVQPWDESRGNHPSTLAGIVYLGYVKWDSGVSYFSPEVSYDTLSVIEFGDGALLKYRVGSTTSHCWNFTQPRDDVLRSLNSLMFVTGVYAPTVFVPASSNLPSDFADLQGKIDPGLPVNVTVPGEVIGEENVFHTNIHWFLAAAAIELLCIALVIPTYWGWWKLGRPVSFSPLEIAKAFEAPLLKDWNSNSSGRDIAKATGEVEVQYGATSEEMSNEIWVGAGRTKLVFGDPGSVKPPTKNTHFDA